MKLVHPQEKMPRRYQDAGDAGDKPGDGILIHLRQLRPAAAPAFALIAVLHLVQYAPILRVKDAQRRRSIPEPIQQLESVAAVPPVQRQRPFSGGRLAGRRRASSGKYGHIIHWYGEFGMGHWYGSATLARHSSTPAAIINNRPSIPPTVIPGSPTVIPSSPAVIPNPPNRHS